MIEEPFADTERQLLVVLVTEAMVRIQSDPAMRSNVKECHDILSRLTGTDTVVVARRAYASHGLRLSTDLTSRDAAYHNPAFPRRLCDACHAPYTGPTIYCSLKCALADA